MNKIYYLSSCSTCIRIIKDLEITQENFTMQDIKNEKITEEQVLQMQCLAGSYEVLFSRRAMKYKSQRLADRILQEENYKNFLLEEYTFLKRPVFIIDEQIFVGNSKKIVEEVRAALDRFQ